MSNLNIVGQKQSFFNSQQQSPQKLRKINNLRNKLPHSETIQAQVFQSQRIPAVGSTSDLKSGQLRSEAQKFQTYIQSLDNKQNLHQSPDASKETPTSFLRKKTKGEENRNQLKQEVGSLIIASQFKQKRVANYSEPSSGTLPDKKDISSNMHMLRSPSQSGIVTQPVTTHLIGSSQLKLQQEKEGQAKVLAHAVKRDHSIRVTKRGSYLLSGQEVETLLGQEMVAGQIQNLHKHAHTEGQLGNLSNQKQFSQLNEGAKNGNDLSSKPIQLQLINNMGSMEEQQEQKRKLLTEPVQGTKIMQMIIQNSLPTSQNNNNTNANMPFQSQNHKNGKLFTSPILHKNVKLDFNRNQDGSAQVNLLRGNQITEVYNQIKQSNDPSDKIQKSLARMPSVQISVSSEEDMNPYENQRQMTKNQKNFKIVQREYEKLKANQELDPKKYKSQQNTLNANKDWDQEVQSFAHKITLRLSTGDSNQPNFQEKFQTDSIEGQNFQNLMYKTTTSSPSQKLNIHEQNENANQQPQSKRFPVVKGTRILSQNSPNQSPNQTLLHSGIQGVNIKALKQTQALQQQMQNLPESLILKAIEGKLGDKIYSSSIHKNQYKPQLNYQNLQLEVDSNVNRQAQQQKMVQQIYRAAQGANPTGNGVIEQKLGSGKVIIVNKSGQAFMRNPNPNAAGPQWQQISYDELIQQLSGKKANIYSNSPKSGLQFQKYFNIEQGSKPSEYSIDIANKILNSQSWGQMDIDQINQNSSPNSARIMHFVPGSLINQSSDQFNQESNQLDSKSPQPVKGVKLTPFRQFGHKRSKHNLHKTKQADSSVSLSTKVTSAASTQKQNSFTPMKTGNQGTANPKNSSKPGQKRVQIFHKPDQTQHENHRVNKAINIINNVIRLIFKNSRDSQALTTSNTNQMFGGAGANRLLEESRLQEISKIAKQMSISIPKKFDSKAALREYVTSREFILNMKIKMNNMLHKAILSSNGIPQNVIEANMYGQTGQIQTQLNLNPSGTTEQNQTQQNGQSQNTNQVYQSKKFFVGGGNNSSIVKSVLKQRYQWQYGSEESFAADCDFIWTSWKKAKHIDFLNKLNLKQKEFVKQVEKQTNQHKEDNENQQESLSAVLAQAKKGTTLSQQSKIDQMVLPLKLYNRMEQNKQLTNKKGVFINMKKYYEAIGEDPFSVLPLTFHTTNGQNDPAYQKFLQAYNDIEKERKQSQMKIKQAIKKFHQERSEKRILNKKKNETKKYQSTACEDSDESNESYTSEEEKQISEIKTKYRAPLNTWILKPGENTNRGQGITVVKTLRDVQNTIRVRDPKSERTYIIQKYIDYPLLVHKRKFDFRCYGILTSINGKLKGYCYQDGYVRTSSREFTLDDVTDPFIHLTNDAIQKDCEDFGKFENANKMSFQDFSKVISAQYPDLDFDFYRDIFPQIQKLMTDTYRAAFLKIDPARLQNTFELFGYDFMIDEDFRLYLIEVNTNPCLEVGCPLLARIIPEVLDNCFKIVLDPLFPTPDLSHNRKFQLNELPQEIKIQLVFDEEIEGQDLKSKLTRTMKGSIEEAEVEEEIQSDQENELAENESCGGCEAY